MLNDRGRGPTSTSKKLAAVMEKIIGPLVVESRSVLSLDRVYVLA